MIENDRFSLLALNSAHLKMWFSTRALALFTFGLFLRSLVFCFKPTSDWSIDWCSCHSICKSETWLILVQRYDDEEEKDDNYGISHLLNKKSDSPYNPESMGDPCSFALIWGSLVDLYGVKTNCGIAHILGIILMNTTYDIQIFQATTICCLSCLNYLNLKHIVF